MKAEVIFDNQPVDEIEVADKTFNVTIAGGIGPQGLKGDVGQQGPKGDKGDKGDQGDIGPQGEQGVVGPKGDIGPQGPKGDQGLKGDKGDKGQQGIKGDTGDKGDTGTGIASITFNQDYSLTLNLTDGTAYNTPSLRGAKGDKGQQGIQGVKGDTGDKGDQGIQGVPGEKGDKGDQGIQGLKGDKGDQGIQGIQGIPGEKGEKGDTYVLTSSDKVEIAQSAAPLVIDDTAGDGVIDKTWSADKIVDALESVGTVQDVQINGNSIVNQGVAEIPIANASTIGVVKINPNNGIGIDSNKDLFVNYPTDIQVKNGTANYRPLVPSKQHSATFYGLAKAAGDTTQSQSSNAVGEYTEEAKIAIQKMLGIYEPPYELLNDFTLEEEGGIDLTADMYGAPYDLRNVLIYVLYPADLASVTSGYGRYRYFDDMGKYVNAETGRYSTNTAIAFKFVTVERKANLTFSYFTKQAPVGGSATLQLKSITSNGIFIGLGNITRIACIDLEPAGTQIKIYGQRAY